MEAVATHSAHRRQSQRLLAALALAAALAAGGCATSGTAAPEAWTTPMQAIERAADAAPVGVPGHYALRVQATGTQDGIVYLNSELDYRDQRNLSVAIAPRTARAMAAKLGMSPLDYYKGKDILVHGSAYRTKIVFFADGKPSGKYYYQTQVRVVDPAQIEVRGR